MLVYRLGNEFFLNVVFSLCCRPVTLRGRTLLPKEPSYNHNSGKHWKLHPCTVLLRSVKLLMNPGNSHSSRLAQSQLDEWPSSGQLLLDQRAESEEESGIRGPSSS